ncbi:MAG: autotransporter-associated beta strand repeat-containing protein [Kiritimatiellae bacterium]|jgi:autotransporter-associated beta strand protein|nr:autotransporter-associated beta strand repeat-containing protein [Kiritimatiellia bacterium]
MKNTNKSVLKLRLTHVAQQTKNTVALFATLGLVGTACAGNKYWDTDAATGLTGGNGTWDTGNTALWSTSTGGSSPLETWDDGDDAIFQVTIEPKSYTNTLSGIVNVNSISKGQGNRVQITGGILQLSAGGLINGEGGEIKALVINSPVVLMVDQSWFVMWTSPSIIRVAGDISEDTAFTELTLARFAGGQGGRYEIYGNNTYSGGTVINGTNTEVWINNANSLGTGPITFDAGLLVNTAELTITNAIVVGPNACPVNPGSLNCANANLTLSGNITGSNTFVTKNVSNSKTLTLSGDNSGFTGMFNNVGGILRFASTNAGSASANWTIGGNGALLDFGGGRIRLGSLNSGSPWAPMTTLANSGTYTLVVGEANTDCTFTSQLNQGANANLALEKQGSAKFTLINHYNAWRGGVTVYDGILAAAKIANDWVACSLGQTGAITLDGGTLQYIGTGDTSNRKLTLGLNSGTLDASGSGVLIMSNTGITLPTGGSRTLTLSGTSTSTNTLAAKLVDDGVNATSLTKAGTGTWIVSAVNTFTGTTTVNDGLLLVNGSFAAGNAVDVNTTGAIGGIGTVNGTITVSAGGQIAPGQDGNGTLTASSLTLGEGGVFDARISAANTCGRIKIPSTGTMTLEDFAVNVEFLNGFELNSPGMMFGVVQNETAGAIDTSSLGIKEGDLVYAGQEYGLRVTFTGNVTDTVVSGHGTGNDIVLYSVSPRTGTVIVIH